MLNMYIREITFVKKLTPFPFHCMHGCFAGFIQPQHANALLCNSTGSRGFLESTVAIICPKPRKVYHNQSIDASCCVLAPIFLKLRLNHISTKGYLLDGQANAAFSSYYNDVEERLERVSENTTDFAGGRRGNLPLLSKPKLRFLKST